MITPQQLLDYTLSSPRRQVIGGLSLLGLLFLLLVLIKGTQIYIAISTPFIPPPEAVTTALSLREEWPRLVRAPASLRATQGTILRAEDPGKVAAIRVESGVAVDAGQVLIDFDTSVEEADLSGASADLDRATRALARAESLRRDKTVSQEFLDQAKSEQVQARARVENLKSRIARKRVVAPFAGIVGIRAVNVGAVVESGAELIPLYAMAPLYVDFSVPQRVVASLAVGQSVSVTVDAFPGRTFSGLVSAINPQVDESTRTVAAQATVLNDDHSLRPGMFGEVAVQLQGVDTVVTVPASAVVHAPYGDSVFVVEKMKDPQSGAEYLGARQQVVKLGAQRGDRRAILSGLDAGAEVASAGGFKLRPGVAVLVNNEVKPSEAAVVSPDDT